jgi:5-methylthioadenosine/S-adenosylhomocysteine deaminase
MTPAPCDLLIDGALVLTLDGAGTVHPDGAVAIAGRSIAAVGPADDLRRAWRPARRIDGRDRLVMPGLVNVHNHTPLMITRGIVEDVGYAPAYTPRLPQGHRLSAEQAYLLARLGAYELLRCGSTTVVDYYRHPESCARALAELGLRAVVGGRIHDADPAALAEARYEHSTAIGEASLAENARLIERWRGHDDGRIRCDWAPHAADTCSRDLLRQVARIARGHPGNIHTHLAQSRGEVDYVRARDGLSPAALFDEVGLLDRRMIAGHCIWLDDAEVGRVGKAAVTVAHAPIGNAKSGTIAPILALAEAGARIALCTDTFSGDLFEAMRWAAAMQRIRAGGFAPDARTVLAWATRGGAEALGLEGDIGSLEAGKRADLILLDRTQPVLAPIVDGVGILVHSASGLSIDTVIVDGRVLLEGGELIVANGPEIVRAAQRVAVQLWRDAGFPTVA